METGREIDEEDGIVTISTVGRCVSSDGEFWQYAGPLLGFHVLLVVVTNFVLCNVRDIADRYQEQKYVAMASALMLEILVVGIPVLVSVNDSAEATFIVLTAIIALDDIGKWRLCPECCSGRILPTACRPLVYVFSHSLLHLWAKDSVST